MTHTNAPLDRRPSKRRRASRTLYLGRLASRIRARTRTVVEALAASFWDRAPAFLETPPATADVATGDLLRALGESTHGVQIIDREWRYRYVNHSAALHTGCRPGECLGRTVMECHPQIERTELYQVLQRCMTDRISEVFEDRVGYPDGTMRTLELHVVPCDAGVIALSHDVTELRRLETQLRHAQKIDFAGRIAGGLAHDFNNLLSVIVTVSSLLLTDSDIAQRNRLHVEVLKGAAERASELIRQLLAFSRRHDSEARPLNLNAILRDVEPILHRLLGNEVGLLTSYLAEPATILADPTQIDQVIMNLAVNAKDAMPEGGTVTISTRNGESQESQGQPQQNYVVLEVTDTGIGMEPDVQARIFEPFFTTKEIGRGTGLGLSTVFSIVQRLKGHIRVRSEPNDGTTFEIHLPSLASDGA